MSAGSIRQGAATAAGSNRSRRKLKNGRPRKSDQRVQLGDRSDLSERIHNADDEGILPGCDHAAEGPAGGRTVQGLQTQTRIEIVFRQARELYGS